MHDSKLTLARVLKEKVRNSGCCIFRVCYFIGLEAWNIFFAALQINRRCFPTDCHSVQVPLIANEGLF